MENQQKNNENPAHRVYDEMGCEDLLLTDNLNEARSVAYNHQCILFDNLTGKVIFDYSCN